MFCENCGKKLIRGYSFCVECGTPVPPEVLEEGGLPGRSDEKPENAPENASADVNSEENKQEERGDVQASMPGIQPIGGNDEGTLVFCPNCGMRMQHNTDTCEKCGMRLGDKPTSSVPLINNNPMDLDGGFGGFGGGIEGFSDSDINRINSFMGGGMPSAYGNENAADNLFGTNSYSASDIEALNRQMSNFSASSSEMPAISKASGAVRQKEPEQGEARKVENFSMSDGAEESVPISDTAVPVIEGCSMDENPEADISLDPYSFLGNSMDDSAEERPVDNVNLFGEPAAEVSEAAEEPAPEAVEEPAPEAFEESAPEAAEEPVSEAVEEPAPEAFEEPAPEAFEEPATEAFEEPAPEAFEEPVPEAAEEPAPEAAEEPAPEAAEEPVPEAVEEPAPEAAEEPAPEAFEEPAPEAAEEASEALNVEPAFEETPAAEPVDDFIPEEMGFIAESAPVISEEPAAPAASATVVTERLPVDDFDFRRPQKPQNTPAENSEEEKPKGNLVYCRNCGQDMYDTEKFCKNCGATYKGAYVPPKTAPSKNGSKASPMVFGKIPLPKFAGICAAVVGVAAAALFLIQPWRIKSNNGGIVDDKTQSSSSTSSSNPVESSSSTSSDNEVVIPSTSTSSPSSTEDSSTSSDVSSSSSESVSSSSSSSSKTSSSSKSSSKSSSSKPVVTPGVTDAKLKSLEQDRKKIMYAAELIGGEVGKMEMLSQNVLYAMNNSTKSNEEAIIAFYETKFATNMISNLKSGKSSVEYAVKTASPANSEFSSLYASLKTLKTRYDSYYNFITSPKGGYSSFTKNCQSYYTMVTSAMGNLTLNKFTGSYSAANKNSAYADMVSSAVAAVRNCTTQLSLLQGQLSGLGTSFERKAFSTVSSDVSAYASAASYAMRAKSYMIMLKGVSSDYTPAANHIDSAYAILNQFIKSCSSLPKTTLNNFSADIRSAIYNANSYANRAAYALS